MTHFRRTSRFAAAIVCAAVALTAAGAVRAADAQNAAEPAADDEASEREAFEAAKELGTIEAWEAFLNNFPKGFRADLARAYVKRLGSESPKPAEAAPAQPAPAAAQGPFDIALSITANQAACDAGGPCSYTVVATNLGGKPFAQQSVIAVGLTPGAAGIAAAGGPWSCQPLGGGAVCFNATPNLGPGQSATIPITFTLRPGVSGALRSCTRISWGGAPGARSVREVQQALNQRGFDAEPADGQLGGKTQQAIRAYQARSGLPQTGEVDLSVLFGLFTQQPQGDANVNNDQACVQTALTLPPAAARTPPATQKRSAKTKGCPSGTVLLEGRCIARSQVTAFCGPGYTRSGSKCVSRYQQPASQPQRRCPPGMIWELGGCTEDD